MAVQTSYSKQIRSALPGLVADIGPYEIASRANKTPANASILFGLAVGIDAANDDGCVLGLGNGFLGLATRRTAKQNTAIASVVGEYLTDETVGVFRSGKIWVTMTNAGGVPGDPVYFDDASGVISSGAPGAGETAIANASLDMSTQAAGELVLIRIGV